MAFIDLTSRHPGRGNHETPGTWRQGGPADDVEDLCAVVDYLKVNFGYVVDMLVGHSRGALVAFRWICTAEDGKNVSSFVNVAGRYRMGVGAKKKTGFKSLPANYMVTYRGFTVWGSYFGFLTRR